MDAPVQAAFIVGGLLIGLLGVHVEQPAVMLVGFVPGAFLGATFAPRFITGVQEPMLTVAVGVVAIVAGIVGAQLAWSVWVLVHAVPGFVAGFALSAPMFGVSMSNPEPGAALAMAAGVGLVGAVVAWMIHRVFVAAFTGVVGSILVSVAAFGENVYVPMGRTVLRNPQRELDLVVASAQNLGTTTIALAVVFAGIQLVTLASGEDAEQRA